MKEKKGTPSLMSDDSSNSYLINIENPNEIVRLAEQDKLFTQAMGGVLPELPAFSDGERILDLACGSGKWAIDVASTYPDCLVTGMDLSRTMVDYARTMAQSQGIGNVDFVVQDVKEPLDYDDAYFQLVNARFLAGVLDRASWPSVLAECKRVLVPTGILRLTEVEIGVSSSPALQALNHLLTIRLLEDNRTFSVDGGTIGMTHMLGQLLLDAGFEQIQKRAFFLDTSHDSLLWGSMYREAHITFHLLKPYLLRSKMITDAAFEKLHREMLIEMLRERFTMISFGLTVWGNVAALSKKEGQ